MPHPIHHSSHRIPPSLPPSLPASNASSPPRSQSAVGQSLAFTMPWLLVPIVICDFLLFPYFLSLPTYHWCSPPLFNASNNSGIIPNQHH